MPVDSANLEIIRVQALRRRDANEMSDCDGAGLADHGGPAFPGAVWGRRS